MSAMFSPNGRHHPHEAWQIRIAHINNVREQFRAHYWDDLNVRPAVVFVLHEAKLWAYGHDALLVGGLLELPMTYHIVESEGKKLVVPEFESEPEMQDFLIKQMEQIGRSAIVIGLDTAPPEGGPPLGFHAA